MEKEKPPELEQRVLDYIQKYQNVTFAELTKKIDGFRGDCTYWATAKENIILWDGISKEAGQVIESLIARKCISIEPCSYLIYFIDGLALRYPIVKRAQSYKKPHWLPVVLNPIQARSTQ